MTPDTIQSLTHSVLPWLDVAGISVFAMSGALAAARAGQTMVTLIFFAAITGVGGGTLRDLLIGAPVFWVHNSVWITACIVVALIVWFTPRRFWVERAVDWFDAVGLSAYAVYGAAKAMVYGIPPLPAVIMGVFTACMGGVIRDVMAGVPSIIIRPEIYVTAAAAASGSFVLLATLGLPTPIAAIGAAALGFGLRAMAIWKGLALPGYHR
ncbi:trimeric intracellular cation channel family protein [Falsirhodobacter halotolerans]|uniref:trimeric intracellular cation channel family protein n=1 Tax=Falsirhodobacter halotolerans TaxID=1146892 RepID=UPI001FD1E5FE|nr:trimeric intracellular cation channel family protein [Falsirhodobacter halotolerans]MCJ8141285.1 trimeric intracellular cation channel family protein [Falsirhodobacter halotolerans]